MKTLKQSFLVEVRRFSDLLTGRRVLPVPWYPGAAVWNVRKSTVFHTLEYIKKKLELFFRFLLTFKLKLDIL